MFLSKVIHVVKVVIILALASVSNAQVIDFDLSNYNPPEFKRHSLDTDLGLLGGHSFIDDNYESESSEKSDERINNSFSFDGSALYSYKKHTTFFQRNLSANINIGPSFAQSNDKTEDVLSENTQRNDRSIFVFNTSLRLEGSNRYYIKVSDLFFETNAVLIPNLAFRDLTNELSNGSFDHYIDNDVPPYDYNESFVTSENEIKDEASKTGINISFDPQIFVGYGRINDVSDARLSVYIYQDLRDKNCLDKTPDAEDIIKLAELITEIKNERFFDARDKKISNLTRIDKFLKDNGFIKENGAVYFTSLYDNWDYAPQTRTSGYRFSAGFVPEFSYERNSTDTKSNSINRRYNNSTDYLDEVGINNIFSENSSEIIENVSSVDKSLETGLFGMVKFEHEKPINLYFQGNFRSSLLFGRSNFENERENDRKTSSDYIYIYESDIFIDSTYTHLELDSLYTTEMNTERDYLEATLSYSLRYFPDTRTDLGVRFTGIYRSIETTREEEEVKTADINDESLIINLYSDMNYYFSPQLRLNGYVSVNYFKNLKKSGYSDVKNEIDSEGISASYGLGLNYFLF